MASSSPSNDALRELHTLAEGISRSLRRRFSWVDGDEVDQQVWLTVLAITQSRDVTNKETHACAFAAAKREVSRMAIKQSAPVSETWHRLSTLRDARSVDIEDAYLFSAAPDPESAATTSQLIARVRRAAFDSAQLVPFGDLAIRVVLNEEKPRDVAKATGVPRKAIYKAVALLKQTMSSLLEDIL